jgi:hypothetical protein
VLFHSEQKTIVLWMISYLPKKTWWTFKMYLNETILEPTICIIHSAFKWVSVSMRIPTVFICIYLLHKFQARTEYQYKYKYSTTKWYTWIHQKVLCKPKHILLYYECSGSDCTSDFRYQKLLHEAMIEKCLKKLTALKFDHSGTYKKILNWYQ